MTKHSAPPVTYPTRRSHVQSLVLSGFWLCGALSSLLWIYGGPALGWRSAISVVFVLVAGLFLYRYWCSSLGDGVLDWDGSNWHWENGATDPHAVFTDQSISVVADFQRFMVLALADIAGKRHWILAQRSVFPERWLDFRRAVYCQRKSPVQAVQIDIVRDTEALPVAVSSHEHTKNSTRIGA